MKPRRGLVKHVADVPFNHLEPRNPNFLYGVQVDVQFAVSFQFKIPDHSVRDGLALFESTWLEENGFALTLYTPNASQIN